MLNLNVKEKGIELLKEGYVCDKCLGRNFAQLLSGITDEERGRIIRNYIAMLIDSGEKISVDNSNFFEIKFHLKKIKTKKPKKCSICFGLFRELKKKAKLIVKKLEKYEYKTILVGCKLTPELISKEDKIWNKVGIEWCESLKTQINRELGKEIAKLTRKDMNRKYPDITIMFDFNDESIDLNIRSIYVYGRYQKLVRNIPQTKWKKKIYSTSVQEIIAKPFLIQAKSKESTFHGSGREDVNVRCLGWRPFILEILEPKKRKLNLKEALRNVNKSKKIKVKNLKIVSKGLVRIIKSADYDKTYRAIVEFEKSVKNLKLIDNLRDSFILQKTPTRVIRRRSDKTRKRKVKNIKYKLLNKRKIELKITTQAGLYVKELINGDDGRTEPSISSLLDNKVKNIELDVIKIHCD